ncbi:MAG: hypothetical protein ACI4LX_09370 [Treponema sp.]
MKLQPLFTVKANELYTIDENNGKPLNPEFTDISDLQSKPDLPSGSFYRVIIEQKVIEPETECYDEAFLASLRDFLKQLEENGQFAVLHIVPGKSEQEKDRISNSSADDESVQMYAACVKHTARRVKDCASVAGIELCSEFIAENAESKIAFLIDELKVKHAQYVYFIKESDGAKISLLEDEYKAVIVLEK